ncbi:hypothetical protein [Komagataeibacter xylinus]|uniref:hypothetical protein n=1 Tax=Komagataeibacter xylinus TaxID=28448 RepID=UPI001F5C603A|nr:hypothetical protein [Komagataeibacter xylinus]
MSERLHLLQAQRRAAILHQGAAAGFYQRDARQQVDGSRTAEADEGERGRDNTRLQVSQQAGRRGRHGP